MKTRALSTLGRILIPVSIALSAIPARADINELHETEPFVTVPADVLRGLERVPGNLPPTAGDPVATSVGEFFTSSVDLDLGGPLPLAFARHYGSFLGQAASFWGFYGTADSPMGANWVHNHQFLLQRRGAAAVAVYYLRGKVVFFEKVGGVWQMTNAPAGFVYMGIPFQMSESGSKLEMMDPQHRLVLTFEFASLAVGQVSGVERVRDRNGNAHEYTYNPDGTLAQVSDARGRSLAFAYQTIAGKPRVVSVTDQTGRAVTYDYLSTSRLREVTSPRGMKTAFTYDAGARLLTLARPRGNVPVTNAWSLGRCISQKDGENHTWSFAYAGSQTTITDPLGHARVHTFDGLLRLIRWRDEAGRSVELGYDANQRLVSTTDRLGDASTVAYHAPSGHVARRIDAEGNTFTYTYEAQAQEGFTFHELARIDFPGGAVETFARDARGNIVAHTDRNGNASSFTYDARGLVLSASNALGGVSSFTYDPSGSLVSRQDPAGNVTSYAYDALFRLSEVTRPDGTIATAAYDPDDNLLALTDENGNTVSWTYDPNDNVASATDPLGNAASFAYDGNDDLVSVSDPSAGLTTLAYDGRRQLVGRTDPNGNAATWSYDALRRLQSVVDGAGRTWSYGYDAEGVLRSVTDPAGALERYSSDRLGRLRKARDRVEAVTYFEQDELGAITLRVDAQGEPTEWTRDAAENVSAITMAEPGMAASYARNGLDQVTSVTDPRGNAWLAQFDASGRLVGETDPLGNQSAIAYDLRNRPDVVTLPGGLGTLDLTFDAASRLTRALFSDGTDLQLAYDAGDQLVAANGIALAYDANGRVEDCNGIAVAYDAGGRIQSLTLAPGKTVSYAYDARDLLVSVTDWVGGQTSFAYDANARLVALTRPNGVTTTFARDAAGRPLSIQDAAGAPLASQNFTYDERGQITAIVRDLPLVAAPPLGDRQFAFDAACQVSGAQYDALGRLTDDGARSYDWDLASRLVSVDAGGGPVTYTHDGAGNIASRTENGTTRDLVWNYAFALPSIAIVREEGADVRYYVHGPEGLLLHSIEAGDDTRRFYHFDQVGSTLFLTDESGAVSDAYAYSPHGELLAQTGGTENPFTWHGQLGVVQDGGLYSMRARWYDPVSMRFLSRDPIRGDDPVRINPYQALFADPLTLVDPMGTDAEPRSGWDGRDLTLEKSHEFGEETAALFQVFFPGRLPRKYVHEPDRLTKGDIQRYLNRDWRQHDPSPLPSPVPLPSEEEPEGRGDRHFRFPRFDYHYNPLRDFLSTFIIPRTGRSQGMDGRLRIDRIPETPRYEESGREAECNRQPPGCLYGRK